MTCTFIVRGHKIRTATKRRYVVVAVREHDYVVEQSEDVSVYGDGILKAFAHIEKRSDNLGTAERLARWMRDNGYRGRGVVVTVVDTTTGEEV